MMVIGKQAVQCLTIFLSLGNRTPTPSPGPSYWPDARYSSAQVVSTPILIIATNISGSRASVSTCQPPKVFLKPTESVRPVFQFATGILLHFLNWEIMMIRLLITSPLTLLCIQFLCMPLSYVDIPPLIGFSSCRPFLLFHLSSLLCT